MLARISGAELAEWAVYEDETGPLDYGHRSDVLAGIVAATIANVNRSKKSRRYRTEDFMPTWGAKRTQTWQEQLQVARLLNRAMGGTEGPSRRKS